MKKSTSHLPVIIAGGPKSDDEMAIFYQLKEVMTHEACGAATGRCVWGSASLEATMKAIHVIIMGDVS